MDIKAFTSEIRDLIIRARTQIAAEKLLTACEKGSFEYRVIENCLKKLAELKKEEMLYHSNGEYMKGSIREENRIAWAKINFALLNVLEELSPEELESN